MNKVVATVVILASVVTLAFCFVIFYLYLTNRTVDQTLATDLTVSSEWTEITPDPPLSKFRMIAELAIALPDYDHDPGENMSGQWRLPDGRVVSPQIEAVDEAGNTILLRHSGFTMSRRDLIIYRPTPDLGSDTKLVKVRIRSDEQFQCEQMFWRNRNMK